MYYRAKEIESKRNRRAHLQSKQANHLERTTRRRTKFDFDLWDQKPEAEVEDKSVEWLNPTTKRHNLRNLKKLPRKTPNDYHSKTSTLNSVQVPHGGSSYNPSYKDHQDLLWKATVVEMNKEKAQQKIDYHTTRMFPDAKQAPTVETFLSEMSEGIVVAGQNVEKESDDEEQQAKSDDEQEEENETKMTKLKTKKQRRKMRERNAELHKLKFVKIGKKKAHDLQRLKTMKKALANKEKISALNMEKRKKAEEWKKAKAAKLSKNAFEEQDLDLKLSEELTGSLRSIKPEGNLLLDRFKSMQKRNVIETTVKYKMVRKNHKRKKVEKRNYKMPYEKPGYIQS